MASASADVRTVNAARYLRQLCKHWSHKLEVDLAETHGTVGFGFGRAEFWAGKTALAVTIAGGDVAARDRLKTILAEHLDRFAFREAPLAFDWRDGEPETAAGSAMMDEAVRHP